MYRRITVSSAPGTPASGSAFAIALFEKTATLPAGYAALDREAGGVIAAALNRGEFSASRGNLVTLYSGRDGSRRIYVLGLGDRAARFNAETIRIGAAKLLRAAFAAKITRLDLRLLAGVGDRLASGGDGTQESSRVSRLASRGEEKSRHQQSSTRDARPGTRDADADILGRAVGDALAISNFEFDAFRGAAGKGNGNGKNAKPPAALDLALSAEPGVAAGLARGLSIGESVNLTRTLAATPPNVAHPQFITAFAQKMAREVGLKCTIIDAARAQKLHMGGLLAVGAAGSHPPAMIVLEHHPRHLAPRLAADRSRETPRQTAGLNIGPLLLVGKAVTFDTGGVSIKPADNMDKMKYDKCGGMAVLGAMHALARLKIPQHVVGIVPVAENMLGHNAYRPGDILTHFNGVTSEILNTDAEGRLILADALAYGTATYKPRAVIDLATLTGACVVALGTVCAGAFCGDMAFRSHLFDAAEYTGERLWHMPLWDEHRQQIKGTHGDIVNAGGREAGACTAAAFLSFFVGPDAPKKLPELPWCHLDIAGVADVKSDTGLYAKGPTGFGVRLLVRAVETLGQMKGKHGLPPAPGASRGLAQPRGEGTKRAVGEDESRAYDAIV